MKQIIQNMRSGALAVTDVPAPKAGRGEILVGTMASLISAGTEKMLIDFAQSSLLGKAQQRPDLVKKVFEKVQRDGLAATMQSVFARLEQPMPLGYAAAGTVLAVGEGLEGEFTVGQRVAVAGAGQANHAEVNAVPKNLAVPVPDNVPDEHACFATLAAIAMQGFRNSKAVLGDHVLVIGLGLVGQLTAQLAKAAGCQVYGVDYDPHRVSLAMDRGCHDVYLMGEAGGAAAYPQAMAFTGDKGFDAVILCAATNSNDPLQMAADLARDRAKIVMTGKCGTTIPYGDFMKKELDFVISRSYGPGRYDPAYEKAGQDYPVGWVRWTERDNLAEALRLMAEGRLQIDPLISHRYPIEHAEEAYELVSEGKVPSLGVVLTYPSDLDSRQKNRINLREIAPKEGEIRLGVLGAGAFTNAVLLPVLKKLPGVQLAGVASRGGMTARKAADRFGFSYASTGTDEILTDTDIDAVVITTRHDSHARLARQALERGKHVFVEKPLALTMEDLEEVFAVLKTSGRALMVGFNRRFSPYTRAVVDHFAQVADTRQILIRVNAGRLEDGNWQSDPEEGGGRLLGEVCHFIDLACCLANDVPRSVTAHQGEGQDNYHIQLTFGNGSVATVMYTSDGDSSFGKEYIEVFGGGAVGVIDNFRSAFFQRNGKKIKFSASGGQNKGHGAELEAFMNMIRGQAQQVLTAEHIYHSSRAVLAAKESVRLQGPVLLDDL